MHAMIEEIALKAHFVEIRADRSRVKSSIADPKDEPYIIVAEIARADAIVTGNRLHFVEPSYGGALVVTARELLDMTREG